MRIEVEKLTPAGEPFAHVYAEGDLQLSEDGPRLSGEATVEGRASRKGEEIRLEGKIKTSVEIICDRCLRPITNPLEVEFMESFIPRESDERTKEETELKQADLHFSIYEGDSIDVDDLAREQVLLALPARFVCREDCKGLCHTCGTDLNENTCSCPQGEIDPRWAALEEIKSRKS